MMGCCPPEGMRAIYYAWRCTAEEKEDGMAIHLPYTVDAPGASVAARPDGMRVLGAAGRNLLSPGSRLGAAG